MNDKRNGRIRVSSRRGIGIRFAAAVAAVCVLVAGIYAIGRKLEQSRYQEERGEMSEGFGLLPALEYQGTPYKQKTDITTVLLIGTDRGEGGRLSDFRQSGQADFLTLVAIDHGAKTIRQLEIDRDTITNVTTLGVFGNETGTRSMQICLAHSFGVKETDSCRYTAKAVQDLLCGARVGFYVSLDMGDIAALNDALGGVEVTFTEDFTAIDPSMAAGSTVKLSGAQAEALLRARMTVGDGTNASRMRRQRIYLDAAIGALRRNISNDSEYAVSVFDTLSGLVTTDMLRSRILSEINRCADYAILDAESLPGEHRIGSDGYMEFHVDEQSIVKWLAEALYEQKR